MAYFFIYIHFMIFYRSPINKLSSICLCMYSYWEMVLWNIKIQDSPKDLLNFLDSSEKCSFLVFVCKNNWIFLNKIVLVTYFGNIHTYTKKNKYYECNENNLPLVHWYFYPPGYVCFYEMLSKNLSKKALNCQQCN